MDPAELDAKLAAALERVTEVYRRELAKAGRARRLSPLQAQVLVYLHLGRFRAQPASLTDLVQRFGLVPATVSEAVTALEAKGFVSKQADRTDRRVVRISLTEQGQRAARELARWTEDLVRAIVPLAEDEKAVMYRGLLRMIDQLEREGKISPSRMCLRCAYYREPSYCELLKRPLSAADLRLDCPDFVARA